MFAMELAKFPPPKPWWVRLRESIADTFYGIFDAIASIPFPRLSAGHSLVTASRVIGWMVPRFAVEPIGLDLRPV